MRVTMLVRCLAMMRGGGETRHLSGMRELTILARRGLPYRPPLLIGGARVRCRRQATVLRITDLRDWVYHSSAASLRRA